MSNIKSSIAPTSGLTAGRGRRILRIIGGALLILIAFGLGAGWRGWWSNDPAAQSEVDQAGQEVADGHSHAHEKDGHDHSHEDNLMLIEVTRQARGNIGLQVGEVGFTDFTRTITVPAIVVERPGRSQIAVVAPLTGVVTRIDVIPGQAIEPGQPLFALRLMHEELVVSQSEFLSTLEQLDVVNKEIKRLVAIAKDGALAGKVVLEREYERQKLEAINRAQDQALLLHGLTSDQVATIRSTRKLITSLTVTAPAAPTDQENSAPRVLQVEDLAVEQGQNVTAGDALCTLSDHAELYVEGQAFQQDADLLNRAAREGAAICALVETAGSKPEEVCNLRILYLANKVDATSRLFPFYATLPNEVARDDRTSDGRRYIGWRFRPGQRLQLKVPVETWKERIVLPVEAVVQDGPESYVFREDGDHFHRCPVQVAYRDQFSVVLADGNDIWPGDRLAMNSAQQLQVALKNKSGGAIDPHAGHNH
jgi:multidrug efflux pump subunit AcrA (membrane-fusion protein)